MCKGCNGPMFVERESSWCKPSKPGDPGKPIDMYAISLIGYGHKADMCVQNVLHKGTLINDSALS
jgi:hypothetical protein